MYTIYKITNKINQKCYIGQTSDKGITRFKRHLSNSKYKKYALCLAIKKYGKDQFIFEELFSAFDRPTADKIEAYFVKELATMTPTGYNMTTGGYGGSHTPEVRALISAKVSGKNHPYYGKARPEHAAKMAIAMLGKNNPMFGKSGKRNPYYGKTHSSEIRAKMKAYWASKRIEKNNA